MDTIDRRGFMKGAAGVGATLGLAGKMLGANDKIDLAIIGQGVRGSYLSGQFKAVGEQDGSCRIVAVCDVYQKRLSKGKDFAKCDGTLVLSSTPSGI